MTVTTIAGISNCVFSRGTTYSAARSGPALMAFASLPVGQDDDRPPYFVAFEGFLEFDTSVIPDADDITAVELSFFPSQASAYKTWVLEARVHDWGASVDAGDWVPGDSVASVVPLVASRHSDQFVVSQWTSLTSEPAFIAAINKSGVTRLFLNSSRFREGATPLHHEVIELFGSEAPKLVITHAASAPPVEEVTTSLPVEVGLSGLLTDAAPVESISTALSFTVSLGGTLTGVAAVVPTLGAVLPFTVGLGGALTIPALGVPRLQAPLSVLIGGSATLTYVTESVQAVQGSLPVLVGIGGTIALPPQYQPPRPLRRSVSRPYRRTSVSRVYKNQFRARRW